MLALDLLGADWSPVFGLSDSAAADALAQGQVDAVCLRGRRVPDLAPAARRSRAQPLCSFGAWTRRAAASATRRSPTCQR